MKTIFLLMLAVLTLISSSIADCGSNATLEDIMCQLNTEDCGKNVTAEAITCQLHLGDIPLCPAKSCKEIADTRLRDARSGFHWLSPTGGTSFQGLCIFSIPSSQSRGWTRVGYLQSNTGCPNGLEEVTAGGRTLCRKTVDIGCSSVSFPSDGIYYSKVCGRVHGYIKDSLDGFNTVHGRICTNCTIDQPYVDGVSITHGSPRQHIWTLAASLTPGNCPCDSEPVSLPPFIGQDYFCDAEGYNTYTIEDRLWDGVDCRTSCCERANWFCKDLPQSTTDDIEFRVCTDQTRGDEDIYIERAEVFVN